MIRSFNWRDCTLLAAIIAIGGALRFYGINHGLSYHPDERHIIMVAERLSWDDMNPHFFAYGSFPFYLLWAVSHIAEAVVSLFGIDRRYTLTSYDGLFLVGRSISVIFGMAAIYFAYRLAIKLFSFNWIALIAAVFVALNPHHIQITRFYAFDGVLVTLCLAALIAILRLTKPSTTTWDFILVGVCLGLSAATKISALSLLVPFAAALMFDLYRQGRIFSWRLFFLSSFALFIALLTFSVVEPYAWLDWKTFIANNQEQLNMVSGRWRPPYAVQYAGTIPYIYPLEQMLKYTIRWPVFILASLGLIITAKLQFRSLNPLHMIILSWIAASYIVIAGYQVKFPRYLAPLYPVLLVYAAFALNELLTFIRDTLNARSMGKILIAGVFAYCAASALAHVSIYRHEHSYVIASRWIFDNIPEGSRLTFGHWDDTLPLHLPNLNPDRYQREGPLSELPLYEAETPEKMSIIAERTAASDYIIFPTQRLYGSILRISEEMPKTSAFFQLLFSGDLGFELVQAVKVQPRFMSFDFSDDLADESISVYDHPPVVIFKNTIRLNQGEILQRLSSPDRFGRLLSREAMLSIAGQSPIATVSSRSGSLASLVLWIVTIEIVSLAFFPLISTICVNFAGRGYALAKPAGVLLFGYVAWLVPSLGMGPASQFTYLIICFLVFVISYHFGFGCSWWRRYFASHRNEVVTCEALFWLTFTFFLSIRALSPEIFWGEKPMDLSFINFFLRSDSLPPQDPWAAGNNMLYYYLGPYLVASLMEMGAVTSAVGYNLAIATLPAFLISSIYALTRRFLTGKVLAIVGAVTVVLASNLEICRLVFIKGMKIDFDTFWAATRLFTSPGFTEHPLWSFLFADLHAHVIALPFAALVLTLGTELSSRSSLKLTRADIYLRVIYSVFLGCLIALNSWDFVVYALLTSFLVFAGYARVLRPSSARRIFELFVYSALEVILLITAAHFFMAPYLLFTRPIEGASWGWNHTFEYNQLSSIISHFGAWFVLILFGLAYLMKHHYLRPGSWLSAVTATVVANIPLLLGVLCIVVGLDKAPWGVLIFSAVLIALTLMAVFLDGGENQGISFAGTCVVVSSLMLSFLEVFFLIDRMNSVFKFYYSLWLIWAVAAVVLAGHALSFIKIRESLLSRFAYTGTLIVAFAPLIITLIGSAINIFIMSTFHRIEGPRPALDGSAYLETANRDEASLISWINNKLEGTPRVLEAQGDSYGPFSRIVMHTGLPTILGWEHHVKQRGTKPEEVEMRKLAISQAYSTTDLDVAEQILSRYKITLIVIGELEHKTYPPRGIEKFLNNPDKYPVLFRSGRTSLIIRRAALQASPDSAPISISWNH